MKRVDFYVFLKISCTVLIFNLANKKPQLKIINGGSIEIAFYNPFNRILFKIIIFS